MVDTASGKGRDLATVRLVSVWAETLLYGVYTTLFFHSMYTMVQGFKGRTMSAKIFIWSAALMYFIATAHVSLAFYRALMRYVWLAGTSAAQTYVSMACTWEHRASSSLNVIMAWIFDCLLTYRCYIIWSKRWYIVVVPIALFFARLAIDIAFLAWWTTSDPTKESPFKLSSQLSLPVTVVQNVLTTGLICFRLIRQHRISRASGIQPSRSRLSLFHVVRIMVESAAIYTALLCITIILQSVNSRGQWIFFAIKPPTIGIVFTLISIRLNILTTRAREPRTTLFTLSPWINNIPSEPGMDQSATVELKSLPAKA